MVAMQFRKVFKHSRSALLPEFSLTPTKPFGGERRAVCRELKPGWLVE
jgi:hypothetical protein